jgi:hypothetical protein
MGSQQPKFQYAPNLLDVWKQLQSVNDDLANEVDNPLPQELQQVVNLLYQRDRQLEDYLTNLPTGGGGGGLPNLEIDTSTAFTATYLGFATQTWGVVDQWSVSVTGLTDIFGSVVTGKIGTAALNLGVSVSASSAIPGPVQFEALLIEYGVDIDLGILQAGIPSGFLDLPLYGGFRSAAPAYAGTVHAPFDRSFYLYATQPPGGTTLGSILTVAGVNLTMSQTQLQA